ncbi:hypothetical protein [Acinetobacter lwoffii]|uniref:hypothetical protein n=1 Tax=Acinetobacter lwoffii TaxID=28090 RepID=UPI00209AA08C|nr:hypothetical protein [Acinetobacter lwoffii]MCO8086696.1 hypothetical protein [Acinetobacter lwoffii]
MQNTPLKQAKAELESARSSIEAMQNSKSFEEFERNWRFFLGCLEKVWAKTERACQDKRNEFQPWQGQFSRLRKKDMLLRYLKQARDADTHSIQEITEIYPGHTSYKSAHKGSHYIKKMVISNGSLSHYEGDPMIQETVMPHPIAIKVQNNGEWYNPPSKHLESPIENHHPVTLALLGLKFYSDFIDQVEIKFFS